MSQKYLYKNIAGLLQGLIFKDRPLYVHYGITHRCNLSCRMCNIYKEADRNEELSIGQIDKVFDILKSLGVLYVSIGGGEPFLRKDLVLVVKLLIKKGFMVRVLTNGTLCEEYSIKELSSMGLREVSISLDSLDYKKQAYICNYKDAWNKTINSVELFSDIIPKRGRSLLINTVVSPLNIKELPQLSQFAKERGYHISFVPIEEDGSSEFTFTQDDSGYIDKSYDYLIREKRKGSSSIFNSSLFLKKSCQYLKSKQRNWQCDAGRLYFSINPKGELSVCHRFKPEVSLLSPAAGEQLRTKEFESRSKGLTKECQGCMRPCWAEISFMARDTRSFLEMTKSRILSAIS